MKESEIIPSTVKKAARVIQDYLGDEKNDLISMLLVMPISKPSYDPDVVVTFDFESYRHGSFTESTCTSLSNYLLVYAANPTLYWYDVLGKHSQLEEKARNLSVRWACGDQDEEIYSRDEWKFPNEQIRHNTKVAKKLKRAAKVFLKSRGPFEIEKNGIPNVYEFVEIYEEILGKLSYAVKLTFQNAKVYYDKRLFQGVEQRISNVDAAFDDAYEAALFYVLRPTVTVRCWQWGCFDENGHPIQKGSETKKMDLKPFNCKYKEERGNTKTSYRTDITWIKTPHEKRLLKKFRELTDFDCQSSFDLYIEKAKELSKTKRQKK